MLSNPRTPRAQAAQAQRRRLRILALAGLSAVFWPTLVSEPPALAGQETTPAATTPAQAPVQTPVQATPAPAPPQADTAQAEPEKHSKTGEREIGEEDIKQQLVGKPLFLRGGFLGDSLSFSENGAPVGHPAVGSYTLSAVEIDKVHLTKHKVELIGARYGLHFLGALPNEDPSKSVDRVKITPKKKVLRITIDREQVIKERKAKPEKGKKAGPSAAPEPASPAAPAAIPATDTAASSAPAPQQAPATAAEAPATPQAPEAAAQSPAEEAADKPADSASVTTTTSPAHAARLLREALDRIFAPGLDDKVRAQMPQFWQLYYQAQAAGVDYRPRDPAVLRSNAVDAQAKLITAIAPESNEYAQASGIAGPALYRVVIGADGKAGEIAVERPIGFGLDENAVSAIRKATFQPAVKEGKPVAETLDLAVLFRIYSKRTSVAAAAEEPDAPKRPILPGPYTVRSPASAPTQPAEQPPPAQPSEPAPPSPPAPANPPIEVPPQTP